MEALTADLTVRSSSSHRAYISLGYYFAGRLNGKWPHRPVDSLMQMEPQCLESCNSIGGFLGQS